MNDEKVKKQALERDLLAFNSVSERSVTARDERYRQPRPQAREQDDQPPAPGVVSRHCARRGRGSRSSSSFVFGSVAAVIVSRSLHLILIVNFLKADCQLSLMSRIRKLGEDYRVYVNFITRSRKDESRCPDEIARP